ncbi:tetratricopeptide repeat protein [Catalinimonas niigatensis]|uniref:tetratricopeptide repeat protein n=1 Tax=Catalinimonas niigatensis TaxID=1397264 RepID=UPI002666C180|nr:tetratricopeptide repeat protein [Catalinimonas niigatensis]WPP49470.1 tetratricopeptide repeat protein [Catalinimonas niigatensis]
MLRLNLFFLLLLCCSLSLQAQSKVDSLQRLLHTIEEDSGKFKVLGDISWEYILKNQLDSATLYADSIQLLAERLHSEERIAYAHFYYGVVARHRGSFSSALDHLQQFVDYYEGTGDSIRVAYGLFQIGVVNSALGDYEKSLTRYYRILHIHEKENNPFKIGYTLNGIGVLYKNMKKYEDAIKTYERALAIYDSLDAKEDQANVLGNLANVHVELHQFDKAKHYFSQALAIDESLGAQRWIAYDLENIGNMYNHMEKYDSALLYQLKALAIREDFTSKSEYAHTLQQLAYTYYLLKNYPLARQQLLKALELGKEIKAKPLLRDIYVTFAKIYDEENNYKEAFAYHQLYTTMKDSILNEESAKQLNELQTKYETAEKDKQIILLANEKELQLKETERQAGLKKASMAGLLLLSILTGLLVYIFRQRLRHQKLLAAKNEEVREANFKREMSELEIKALRAQINPHFLFNCMNSINRMILQGETDSASLYLTKFSKLVRLILENTEATRVSLENELAMLESYIQLEALRFKGKIHYKIQVDESLEPENTFLPSMVLQPFVENAIWHGLMHKDDPGTITIAIREEDDRLLCTIEDDGVGREKAQVLQEKSVYKQKSMGIQLTEERLRLLSKERLEQLIRITDLKDSLNQVLGTRVDILVPMA